MNEESLSDVEISENSFAEWTILHQAELIVTHMRDAYIQSFGLDEKSIEQKAAIESVFHMQVIAMRDSVEFLSAKFERDFEEKYDKGGKIIVAHRKLGWINIALALATDALRYIRQEPPNGNAFYYICRASMFAGLVMGQDDGRLISKFIFSEQKSNAATARHKQNNEFIQPVIKKTIELWEAGNTTDNRWWNSFTECATAIFNHPEINKPYRTVYDWISKYEKSKKAKS